MIEALYIPLDGKEKRSSWARSHSQMDTVILDYDHDDQLIGIELLGSAAQASVSAVAALLPDGGVPSTPMFMNPQALIDELQKVKPNHLLAKNRTGNLAIFDEAGDYVGYLDLNACQLEYEPGHDPRDPD